MALAPVHFAFDIEPDERLPAPGGALCDDAAKVFAAIAARRARIEDATGAPARFGWYVRMDNHIRALYGDATGLAQAHRAALEAAAEAGDEIGLHIHCIDRDRQGAWRVNYADREFVEDNISRSFAAYEAFFGRPCRSARMGDMWTSAYAQRALASAGAQFDLSLETNLRRAPIADAYPKGTACEGARPDALGAPTAPFQPFAGVDDGVGEDFWVIPLSSYRRADYANPRFWLMSGYAAVKTRFRQRSARDILRPYLPYPPQALRARILRVFNEQDRPALFVVSRNFMCGETVLRFLDCLCDLARERPLRFCTPAEYVSLAAGPAK